jgi:hypothetical protein
MLVGITSIVKPNARKIKGIVTQKKKWEQDSNIVRSRESKSGEFNRSGRNIRKHTRLLLLVKISVFQKTVARRWVIPE